MTITDISQVDSIITFPLGAVFFFEKVPVDRGPAVEAAGYYPWKMDFEVRALVVGHKEPDLVVLNVLQSAQWVLNSHLEMSYHYNDLMKYNPRRIA